MSAGGAGGAGDGLSIDQLASLREKTDVVSQLLRNRLAGHLETLQLSCSPRWVLGKHTRAGGRDEVPGSDRNYQELEETYAKHYGPPFLLPKELPDGALSIDGRLDLYPWETTETVGGDEGKEITMTSPDRWVVNYRSGYTLSQLRKAVASRASLRHEDAQQFVLNAIVLAMAFAKNPGLTRMLADLRWDVRFEPAHGLGELPLVSIGSCLPAFRPDDGLILAATRFSGVPEFIELIDLDAVDALEDPLRQEIREALG